MVIVEFYRCLDLFSVIILRLFCMVIGHCQVSVSAIVFQMTRIICPLSSPPPSSLSSVFRADSVLPRHQSAQPITTRQLSDRKYTVIKMPSRESGQEGTVAPYISSDPPLFPTPFPFLLPPPLTPWCVVGKLVASDLSLSPPLYAFLNATAGCFLVSSHIP